MDIDDLMENLFTEKYTYQEKLAGLASLERDSEEFIRLIKRYHPEYYISWDHSIASINLVQDLQNNFPSFKYQ